MKRLTALLLALLLLVPLIPTAFAADDDVKVAAFTFDDGPHKTITPALLDGLAQRGVRATFFVNGANAERYPDIVLRAAMEGHQIANHTYSHSRLTSLSAEKVKYEISRTENFLSGLLGKENFLIRVPYGAINDTVQSLIQVPIMMWSVDPTSGRVMSAAAMRDGIVRTAHDGAIILLHDMSQANLDAALQSIDILMARGYTFVTLDELFEIKGIAPQGGTVYRKLAGDNVAPFFDGKDITTHWAWKDIQLTQEAGVMVGDGNSFRPEWGMTRAEAITVLHRMAGYPGGYPTPTFEDVKSGDWFAAAVAWAVAEGVTQGVSATRFDPTGYVTKEQFYTLFARYILADTVPGPGENEPEILTPAVGGADPAPAPGEEPLPEEAPTAAPEPSPAPLPEVLFQPVNGDETCSAWAADSIRQLRTLGFVSAAHAPRFFPKAGITRAETAELIAWYLRSHDAPASSPVPAKPEPVSPAADRDAAIAAALRERYGSAVPDGLIHVESYEVLGYEPLTTETVVGVPREEAVYLMVCAMTYSITDGEPGEVSCTITPAAITFTIDDKGAYAVKEYWTPDADTDYTSEILAKFPTDAARAALDPDLYADALEAANRELLTAYLEKLSENR